MSIQQRLMREIKHIAARQHPTLFYSDIFTPISRGRRKKAVEWKKQIGYTTVTIAMFNQLDIADQDLLLCILAIGRTIVKTFEREQDYFIINEGDTDKEKKLITELEATFTKKDGAMLKPSNRSNFSVDQLPALVITTNAYQILSDLNRPINGSSYKWLDESLTRLSRTSFELEDKRYKYGGSRLLSYMTDKNTKEITITLNALSAHSVWAENGDYIYSDRRERHALQTDLARSLHDKLCARVRAGEKDRRFYVDNMLLSIFNDDEPAAVGKTAVTNRRASFKRAAEEINGLLLWSASVAGKGSNQLLTVSRKK
ncbi:TPA: replication protein C, IncQ-type [Photobacterium damselae]